MLVCLYKLDASESLPSGRGRMTVAYNTLARTSAVGPCSGVSIHIHVHVLVIRLPRREEFFFLEDVGLLSPILHCLDDRSRCVSHLSPADYDKFRRTNIYTID